MDNRCKTNVLEGKGGISFIAAGEVSGEIKINMEDRVRVYENPPIPTGYRYVGGEKYRGWTIERIFDKSLDFWLPIESLEANGTLDGFNFTEKLGRRFDLKEDYYEEVNGEIFEQILSCRRYGGMYIFKYPISLNDTGQAKSVKTDNPFRTKKIDDAREIARNMDTRQDESVKTHLVYGAEWDSFLEWIKESDEKLDKIWDGFHCWTQERNVGMHYYSEWADEGFVLRMLHHKKPYDAGHRDPGIIACAMCLK